MQQIRTYVLDGKTYTNVEEYRIDLCKKLDATYTPSDKLVADKTARDTEAKRKFTQGVFIDAINTRYGTIHKVSINVDKFRHDNTITNAGYIHFFIKQAKSGKYYAENQT